MTSLYLMPCHGDYRYCTLMLCEASSCFKTAKMIAMFKGNISMHCEEV